MTEVGEKLLLSQAKIEIPSKIIGHASVKGSRTISTEEIAQSLVDSGADPKDASYEHLRAVVGEAMLPRANDDESPESLAIDVAKKVIEEFDIDPKEIGLVIFATSTPSLMVPEPSKYIHRELDLGKNCGSFTVSNACQGWVDAYVLASSMLTTNPRISKALVIGSDTVSRHLRPDDSDTQAIFSDMASAFVLEADPEGSSGIIRYGSASDGSTLDNFILGHGEADRVDMKGRGVAKSILRLVPTAITNALTLEDGRQFDLSELKLIASHQPSSAMLQIIRTVVSRIGVEAEVPDNFHRLGNSSAATTPANLDIIIREGRIKRGDYFGILSAAVGSSAMFLMARY